MTGDIVTSPSRGLRLDLGSGQNPRKGFVGVDSAPLDLPGSRFVQVDLACGKPWPWPNESVDELASSHFIEHLPATEVYAPGGRQDALFWFFDECYRIAKPGCLFHLRWPALESAQAFMDPTHRRFIPRQTLNYLGADWRRRCGLDHYRVACNWHCTEFVTGLHPEVAAGSEPFDDSRWNQAVEYQAVLEKPPPPTLQSSADPTTSEIGASCPA